MTDGKKQIWVPLLAALILILGMFFGYKLRDSMGIYGPSFSSASNKTSLREILSIVDKHYVDSVDTDSLSNLAIQTVLQQLDPHSAFIPASDVNFRDQELQGNFEGIGLEFTLLRDTVYVLGVSQGAPADVAGISKGDKLLAVDGQAISGVRKTEDEIRDMVLGPKGTRFQLTYLQNGKRLEKKIERAVIKNSSVDLAYMIQPGIGYIRINRFASTAYEEFMQELEKLKGAGMQKLILDLRDNTGGLMDDAIQMADEFLDDAKDIVYTEGKSSPRKTYQARRPGLFEKGKLIVLINEHSASASEVLSGALQDWDRATIIGRRSYGKGLVQEQFNLSDGSALRLTVSRYYTPIGRNIQKPYDRGRDSAYNHELDDRYRNGELTHNDTSRHNGKAYRTKAGRLVYGGGGISPDIFIPADSSTIRMQNEQPYLFRVAEETAFEFYLTHKATWKNNRSATEWEQYFERDISARSQITEMILKKIPSGITLSLQNTNRLYSHASELIVRLYGGRADFLKYQHLKDPMVLKSLETLK